MVLDFINGGEMFSHLRKIGRFRFGAFCFSRHCMFVTFGKFLLNYSTNVCLSVTRTAFWSMTKAGICVSYICVASIAEILPIYTSYHIYIRLFNYTHTSPMWCVFMKLRFYPPPSSQTHTRLNIQLWNCWRSILFFVNKAMNAQVIWGKDNASSKPTASGVFSSSLCSRRASSLISPISALLESAYIVFFIIFTNSGLRKILIISIVREDGSHHSMWGWHEASSFFLRSRFIITRCFHAFSTLRVTEWP